MRKRTFIIGASLTIFLIFQLTFALNTVRTVENTEKDRINFVLPSLNLDDQFINGINKHFIKAELKGAQINEANTLKQTIEDSTDLNKTGANYSVAVEKDDISNHNYELSQVLVNKEVIKSDIYKYYPKRVPLGNNNSNKKWLSGRIMGEDGRHVNVLLGFDLTDKYGRKLKMDGSLSTGGYTNWFRINRGITYDGVADDSPGTTHRWVLPDLPDNAVKAWVEVYPKDGWGGTTDVRSYCRAMWHNIDIASNGNPDVNIILPLRDGVRGGKSGGINGYAYKDGKPVQGANFSAFSISHVSWPEDYSSSLGFSFGSSGSNGYYRIEALSPNQYYKVYASYGGKTIVKKYIYVPQSKVVGAFNFNF